MEAHAPSRPQWRDLSAFDALDESWVEPEDRADAAIVVPDSHHETARHSDAPHIETHHNSRTSSSHQSISDVQDRAPLTSSRRANSAVLSRTIATDKEVKYDEATSRYARARRRNRARRRSSGAMTDSELLQPGPSSPSLRIPSHKLPSQDVLSTVPIDEGRTMSLPSSPSASLAFHEAASPSRSANSVSTSSSGEKQGARISIRLEDAGPSSAHHENTQTARSISPIQDDVNGVSTNLSALEQDDQFGSAREDATSSRAAVTAEEATFIEHSSIGSPPAFMKPAWANKDKKSRPKDIFAPLPLQALFDPPSPRSTPGRKEGTDDHTTELESERGGGHTANEEKEDRPSGDIVQHLNRSSDGRENIDMPASGLGQSSSGDVDLAARVEVPRCTFTFSSPVTRPKRPPPTPSTSHAPLRLFHLEGRNPEIEHILNTPRSAAKSRDAKKIVWKLVEEEGKGERERKRLRMDRIPEPSERTAVTKDHEADERNLSGSNGRKRISAHSVGAAANRNGTTAARAISDGSSRTVSSLIARRKGAKAPTPQKAMLYGHLLGSGTRRGESPRKLLRRWSAANQVDEELEETREADRTVSDEVWQDIPEDNMHRQSVSSRVPSVLVNPPAAPFLGHVPSDPAALARSTEHPGMLHIAPDAVNLRDMEAMANGKMTFDGKMKRWLQVRNFQGGIGQVLNEDSSDPFRDFESHASPHEASRIRDSRQHDGLESSLAQAPFASSRAQLAPPRNWSSNSALLTPAKAAVPDGNQSTTPRSILKTAGSSRWPVDQATPTQSRQANRKISFADGINPRSSSSRRKERLSELLHQLGQLALHSDEDVEQVKMGEAGEQLQTATGSPTTPTESLSAFSAPTSARSPWNLSMLRASGKSRAGDAGHASFLTNASFNVAHDRVLELLTDVAPWTTRWHDMRSIDLRGRRVESLVRIDEFLPRVEEALLDNNEISYLTGLPNTLRRLSIAHNRLPSTSAFGHLSNLESLDVSDNDIDLKALRNLVQLRHLRANNNKFTSVDGIAHLDKLETLHLRGNAIGSIVIEEGQWPGLQDLVLSRNCLVDVRGIGFLRRLRCLNLDHNQLSEIDLGVSMAKMKQLRVSGNPGLYTLDVGPAYNLRTLYADECALDEVKNIGMLAKLDNLSLRQQCGARSLHWPAHEIRDVKRLFLSGNAFRAVDLSRPLRTVPPTKSTAAPTGVTQFFGLVYLELSGCQLTSLPPELAEMVPNLRHLNADFNLLESLPTMTNLRRLKRISLVGCRIEKSGPLVESLQGCEELAFLDVRMNPCTLGLYPPVVTAVPRGGDAKINRAFLPPIPYPLFAGKQPATSAVEQTDANAELSSAAEGSIRMGSLAEKSFFHKRRPPPPLFGESRDKLQDGSHKGAGDLQGAMFAASDDRFARTLPAQFRLQRLLHRGTLAMACPNLTWLDGLLIDEEEVRKADQHLRRPTSVDMPYNHGQALDGDSRSSDSLLSSDDAVLR